MKAKPPKIDLRQFEDIEDTLKGLIPHYTPEWTASDEKDPGVALLKIFTHMTEGIINRLNQVPQKNFVAFLDMLGIKRLPAQPSRAPVTFILAKGLDMEILVPERTQVTADKTDEHEELTFETEKILMATPSQLVKVFGVDPFKDAIYESPKKFLNSEIKSKNILDYKIVSYAPKGAKNFQLDHATGLEKEDILKIADPDRVEYVTISDIKATIIKTEDKLKFDHSPNTKTEKITQFNLFEGKNKQEHILYLGHTDLFNIKGKAQFNLHVTYRTETEKAATHLENISWEYWGEVKEENAKGGKKEEGDDWHEFEVIDGTDGFTGNGDIKLSKLKDGEIKEKEIKLIEDEENEKNSLKSRWIRCKLKDPLGIDIFRKLPELDNIVLTAESVGEKLPDLAFNNDTPLDLDITKSFLPFGKEPRIYDTFAIGSKEIFSKKGANIDINVKVEPRGILEPGGFLGAPTANLFNNGKKIKIFAKGTFGRLVEAEIDPTGETGEVWTDHKHPDNVEIDSESIPCTVTDATGTNLVSVFVKDGNGRLRERFFNGNGWRWVEDHGTPKEGVTIKFNPAAIYYETFGISVFVTGSDGNLYEFNRIAGDAKGKWIQHRIEPYIDSSPYAVSYVISNRETRVKIFVKDKNGDLYELDCIPGKENGEWNNYESPQPIKVDSRPFAVVYCKSKLNNIYCAKVFVKGSNGELYRCDTDCDKETKKWKNSKKPSNRNKITSDPHGYLTNPDSFDHRHEGKHIFVKCEDNQLWELLDDFNPEKPGDKKNIWKPHGTPSDSQLYLSPFVVYQKNENNVYVISASNQNSIIEKRSINSKWEEWKTYKDPNDTGINPVLSWEYWNKAGWVLLKVEKDGTSNFLKDGSIKFKLPNNIEETEVVGQKNYWIRVRIVGGNYGNETFILIKERLVSDKSSIRPPIIKNLSINYHLETKIDPQYCITYNNLEYIDQTEASRIKDKFFKPFIQLDDKNLSIYLSFDKILKGGPLRIFFAAKELKFTEENKPKMEWAYSIENGWSELKGNSDNTEGLIKSDILEFAGPFDFSVRPRFGKCLFWLKGSLTKGKYEESPLLDGIYPNTTWALQAETIKDEILGSSNGLPDQVFTLLKLPVLKGEQIRVREFLSDEEKQEIVKNFETERILDKEKVKPVIEVKDEKGKVIENWVLWSEVPYFFDSEQNDRHYTLDRATGKLQFGNGTNGMTPPIGENNIKAFSYQTGGGEQGNIKAGEIKSLKSSVPGIDKVLNPVAADGGANAAAFEQMLEIGPAMISHRNRAVTQEDFEWLAKKASRKIAKVKCLPNTNNRINIDNEHVREIGWVTVIIVPEGKMPKPAPSLELKREVSKYLEDHCANTLAFVRHVWVDGPSYVEISILADVFVTSLDKVSVVEREAKKKLDEFFHPLTGGPEEKGWDFGRDVNVSDIYALLGNIDGVDHVENLRLDYSGPAGKDYLFCWNEIQDGDNPRFIKYLKDNFDMGWVRNASIKNRDALNASLFSWDEFSGKDNSRLIEFLIQNFNASWIRAADIDKSIQNTIKISDGENCISLKLNHRKDRMKVIINDIRAEEFIVMKEDGRLIINIRTIKISNGESTLFLRLNNDETRVNMITSDGRADEFIVRREDGRLNAYSKDMVEIRPDFLVANGKHTINVQMKREDEYYGSA